MTFAEAIGMLEDGQAAKRPSMAGYAKKEVLSVDAETGEATQYQIVFVTRGASDPDASGTEYPMANTKIALTDDDGTYRFTWTNGVWAGPDDGTAGDADEAQSAKRALAIDAQLFTSLLAFDWEVTTADEAETARTGSGNRW